MKAIVQDRYGTVDDLRLAEVDPPYLVDGDLKGRVVITF